MRKAVFAVLLTLSLAGCHANPKYVCAPAKPAACPLPLCPATPNVQARDLRNLVLEGGGVKGVAYPGALQVLQSQGILPKIEKVAGTSAGSIVAALIALGYSPEQMQSLMLDLDFKQFEDGSVLGGPERFFRKFGWFKGDYFLEWMQCRVKEQTGDSNATFADLARDRSKFKDLFVLSTDLSRRRTQVFSNATSPDLPVAQAVRASMSIPLFFEGYYVDGALFGETGETGQKQDLFVDGGVLDNYPIELFDQNGVNPQTLGLFLYNQGAPVNPDYKIDSFPEYARNLFEALLNVQVNAFNNNPDDQKRTIKINDLGVGTTDFSASNELKCKLIQQGVIDACKYLGGEAQPLQ
ncbi:MAG TPA: patatin-like phospholipase family protein [Thermoanaerobaculia bacterium]|jgi:NTE family protein|nr:patatin-like phospholipase family protein [Thermoanaerobaculia bacterium]